jgi:hypothetical protein
LEPSQKAVLLKEVPLKSGELPIIGCVESQDNWLIVTTERIVWRLDGKTQTLPIQDVWHVKADFPKTVATGVRKHQLRELQIETVSHEQCTIEVEEGAPPLSGMPWLCANRKQACTFTPIEAASTAAKRCANP